MLVLSNLFHVPVVDLQRRQSNSNDSEIVNTKQLSNHERCNINEIIKITIE